MADKEGHVTMADTQVKSLVSEQYLDGWSYEDDDESGSAPSSPPSSHRNQTKTASSSSSHIKRHHSDTGPDEDGAEPAKRKFNMSLSSKGVVGSANTGGPPPPPPPSSANNSVSSGTTLTTKKIGMNIGLSSAKSKAVPIKMNLSGQSKPKESAPTSSIKKSSAVAQAFGDDSDESEEEMPPEARMRMRNIGRETPTAAGPNSFGKGRLGFCDRQKIIERELQKKTEDSE